jgi:fucose 4-O-acetylase-like acetyltransferase
MSERQEHTIGRNNYFDFVSGIAMLWIIVWHIFQHLKWNDTNMAAFFTFLALAWFFFRSGYFYQESRQPASQYVKGKFQRLFIPFVSWAFIGFIFYALYKIWEQSIPLYKICLDPFYYFFMYGSGGNGNLATWFLLSLFFVFILVYFIDKLKINKLVLSFPFIGALFSFLKIKLFLGLSNIFLATSFFEMGRCWNKYNGKISKKCTITLVIFVVFLSILLLTKYLSVIDFWTNTTISRNYLVAFLTTLLIMYLLVIISTLFKFPRILIVNFIGRHSMVFFVIHWIIINLWLNICKMTEWTISNELNFIILFVLIVGIGSVLVKPIEKNKYLFGK